MSRPVRRSRSLRTPLTDPVRDSDDSSVAVSQYLDPSESVFHGHYRGFPIFAGVFLVELAHEAAILNPPASAPPMRLTELESARFLRPSYPGDTLTFTVKWSTDGGVLRCRVSAASTTGPVARIRLRFRTTEADSEVLHPLEPPLVPGRDSRGLTLPQLMARIPHRDQMLLIDRVDAVTAERVEAVKSVSWGECWYRGLTEDVEDLSAYEYPLGPLMESWNQAAAVLATADKPNTDVLASEVLILGSYTGMTFGVSVYPGDCVEHSVRISKSIGDMQIFEGTARVRGGGIALVVEQAVLARQPAGRLLSPS